MNILIVGKSDLGIATQKLCGGIVVGRPQYDLSKEGSCNKLLQDHNPDCVVLTQGILGKLSTPWEMSTVNYTSMVHLIACFYNKMTQGQIIVVSSATTAWTSWPGIDMDRLVYACNKEALSSFCKNLNRKNIPSQPEKDVSIQVYEPNAFASKMNSNGVNIDIAAKELKYLIENPRISMLQGLNRFA